MTEGAGHLSESRQRRFRPYPAYKDSGVEWLGEIPAHWEVQKLSWLTKCLDGRRVPLNAEERGRMQGDYPYWGANSIVDHVDQWLFDEELILLGEDGAPFFDRSRPVAFRVAGKIWVNNHAHVLRPRAEMDAAFLAGTLNCVDYRAFIDGSTRDKLTQGDMKAIPIQCPPVQEQGAIAEFLDRETAKIDALVAKKERLIELLQEKRTALITSAVTRGLDSSVPMKDSGVKWLGEIPAHWEVVGSRVLFTHRKKSALPDDQQLTASQQYGVIPQRKFIKTEGRSVVQVVTGADILKHVEPNDFVMSMRSFQGGLEHSNYRGRISSAYVIVRPSDRADSGYFSYALKSTTYIQALQSTSDLVRDGQALRFSNFVQVPLPLIPPQEQKAIASYLDEKVAQLDRLGDAMARAIRLLKEYRTALISAAVTGKIDVRKEAA